MSSSTGMTDFLELELTQIEGEISGTSNSSVHGFRGSCYYFHYGLQGIDDRGWGCGYRTLQTILSWFLVNRSCSFEMPDLFQVQKLLCDIGDKPASFHHSKEWIGSYECGVVVELLTQVTTRHFKRQPNSIILGCFMSLMESSR
ncbi:Ufm1-specific protease 2 [Fasciola hepatica]|uniref:Ufm1-specific protease 2 n=1 Tax=Fasciola hepatica TaxID=6192 RepID=A0A4E0RBQ1_FASHE|nr:Ufm1-specific protease 2 [Fasciola hepatica]